MMLRLEISQQFSKVGLSIAKSEFEIEQKSPEVKLKNSKPTIKLDSVQSEINIDWSEAFSQWDLKNIEQFRDRYISKSYVSAQKAIASTIREGDLLSRIETGNTIGVLEKNKSIQGDQPEINVQAVPTVGSLKIQFNPHDLTMRSDPDSLQLDVDTALPTTYFRPSQIKSYLIEKYRVDINVVGDQFNILA
jgi:hypothetical protein